MIYEPNLHTDEKIDPETGLILCRRCGTPRQRRIALSDGFHTIYCHCKCQIRTYEQQEYERKQLVSLEQIAKYRSIGLPTPELRTYTFDNDRGFSPRTTDISKRFVTHWPEFFKHGSGLLLWGDTGVGKTFFAGCIANALLDMGIPVLMSSILRLLNELADFSGRNAFIDSLNGFPLLIIDDLGSERSSDYTQEQVFNLIDSRYRSNLPLIITTNLTLDQLTNPDSITKRRTYERVLERCTPVLIDSISVREQQANANIALATRLLSPKDQI